MWIDRKLLAETEATMRWTPWRALEGAQRGGVIPKEPGLYRVRRVGNDFSDYIGQSGNVRSRVSHLQGIYRVRAASTLEIVYIGQGAIASRLTTHASKSKSRSTEQGLVFSAARGLECSWVCNDAWHPHQRLELEVDLIGSYVLTRGAVPAAQFIG